MIKVTVFFRRRPGMGIAEFQAYWLTTHADIVSRLPGLKRYVQSHTLPSGYRRSEPPPYDGIAELWFDDLAAMKALAGTPEQQAVDADEGRFIDRASMGRILTDEHVIKDGAVPPGPEASVKNVEFLTKPRDMPVEAFQRYWREVHGPIAREIPQIIRYVQNHVRAGGYRGGRIPAYDGTAVTWFASTAAMRDAARTEAYARTRADEANFLPPGELPIIITREHVIVGAGGLR